MTGEVFTIIVLAASLAGLGLLLFVVWRERDHYMGRVLWAENEARIQSDKAQAHKEAQHDAEKKYYALLNGPEHAEALEAYYSGKSPGQLQAKAEGKILAFSTAEPAPCGCPVVWTGDPVYGAHMVAEGRSEYASYQGRVVNHIDTCVLSPNHPERRPGATITEAVRQGIQHAKGFFQA